MTTGRSTENLWQDYLFLTGETAKFAAAGDLAMVGDLLEQRQRLQETIDSQADKAFLVSPAGAVIVRQIGEKNDFIKQRLSALVNREKKQQAVNRAYDGGYTPRPVGSWMDKQG